MSKSVFELMHDFQKSKSTTKQCIANTQYFYDCVNTNCPEEKPRAVAVICIAGIKVIIHTVVMLGSELYDPSVEVFSVADAIYFKNITDFRKAYHAAGHDSKQLDIRWIITKLIEFTEYAESINNGNLPVADREYYDEQANYVESRFHKKLKGKRTRDGI